MGDSLRYLDKNTARLITSNQVILSPYNVVKELVENALDANATQLEIRLDNFGLDKVEVKDNGKGIKKSDVALMFLPGHSSKIKEFTDIESLTTYGFRGEALAAMCCVAECSVTTKTKDDPVATTYKLDSEGNILESKPSPLGQGTMISVTQLFHHQPARRRMMLSGKGGGTIGASKTTTFSHIRNYLGAMGVAWPGVRISLVHNGSLVWRKQPVSPNNITPLLTAFGETMGHALAASFQWLKSDANSSTPINLLVPKIGCKIRAVSQSTKAGMVIILNKRVIHHKKIEKTLMHYFCNRFTELGRQKYPACVVELTLDFRDVDINLEPDKSKILINAEKEVLVLDELSKLLAAYYGDQLSTFNDSPTTNEAETPSVDDAELEVVEPTAKKARLANGTEDIGSRETKVTPGYTIEILSNEEEGNKRNPMDSLLDQCLETSVTAQVTSTQNGDLLSPQRSPASINNGPVNNNDVVSPLRSQTPSTNMVSRSVVSSIESSTCNGGVPITSLSVPQEFGNLSSASSSDENSPQLYQNSRHFTQSPLRLPQVQASENASSSTGFVDTSQPQSPVRLQQAQSSHNASSSVSFVETSQPQSPVTLQQAQASHNASSSASFVETSQPQSPVTLQQVQLSHNASSSVSFVETSQVQSPLRLPQVQASQSTSSPASSLTSPELSDKTVLSAAEHDTSGVSELETSMELSDEDQNALLELEKLYSENQSSDSEACQSQEILQADWSRGHFATKDGKLKSCSILTPPPIKDASFAFDTQETTGSSSQMGCREHAGFVLFCKETRPQILQADPGIVFTAVAQILARRWKELPSEEKQRYGELAKQFKEARRLVAATKNASLKIGIVQRNEQKKEVKKKKSPATNKATPNKPTESKKKVNNKKPVTPRKEMQISVNVSELAEELTKESKVEPAKLLSCVVGRVNNCWLLKQGLSISILSPWALLETLLLEQLKSEMILPLTLLDAPLSFNFKEIGWQAWQALSSLDAQWDVMSNSTEISSPLLNSNGFRITVKKQQDNCTLDSAHLTHLTTVVKGFGLQDLKNLLLFIGNNPNCTLAQSRQQVIVHHMEAIATEEARKMFETAESNNCTKIEDMLAQWNSKNLDHTHCPHGKEIFTQLHTIMSN